ncbi:MAG: YbhB/YbcL family Raf kinase inhibitor-like protein [Methanoregula sp.]|jgi:Raf kinase inhibitor-like YbhB/YbcL family protein|nr:YbhB/YbcL family Raf kinase inhibitor-like protein [Methanoregula sp.]
MIEELGVSLDFLEFPPAHTCHGENLSPKISLKGLKGASIVIMVFDTSIRNCLSFTPWIIWNIPAQPVIPAGIPHGRIIISPVSAIQGTNDTGQIGYTGPCPRPGESHRYVFRVYGLDEEIDLYGGSTKYQLNAAMQGHIVQYGMTDAVCTR